MLGLGYRVRVRARARVKVRVTSSHLVQGIRPETLLVDNPGIVPDHDVYRLAQEFCLSNHVLTLSPLGTLEQVFFKEGQLVARSTTRFRVTSCVDGRPTCGTDEPFANDIGRRQVFTRTQLLLKVFPT